MAERSMPNEEAIFDAAIQIEDRAERDAYLEEVCGGDEGLRASVLTLLRYHDAGSFLDAPALEADPNFSESTPTEGPGATIGRYKLLERIGEGGMAVVYMAEQERPIRRKVALKIIKLGMDTRHVIARFEAERQALAMMDHPNIARVLDAGATETGRPYFVMELVTGVSVTEYCDRNRLPTKERLSLFVQICDAVQHAHQKGIIHRDIKPSNVMVTIRGGQPVPKVIDFGIAKATNQKLTEKTLFTRYAHIIGTPAYMSPEQAELSDLDVDTRSDIYSLGVLLYELLTGTTPFSEEELRKAGYLEMHRVIREEEPLKPSTKLTTLEANVSEVAANHQTVPDMLRRAIRGDLDWIVMKALEKKAESRYETVDALRVDIQRHLGSEPVLARGPSSLYQLQKLLYRRRTEAAILLFIVIALTGVGFVFSMWSQDRKELAEAEAFRHRNLLSEARELHARGHLQAALEQVSPLLASDHVGSEARLLYAGILVEGQQPEEAVVTLEKLLGDRPEIAGAAHSLMARVLWENLSADAPELDKVEGHRKVAEELLAETAEAYFLRAMTVFTIQEKLELLDHALRLDPGHYESRRLRSFTFYASRKYDRMRDDAMAMIALRPQSALGYSLAATACHEMGRLEEAIAHYEHVISLTSEEAPEYVELHARRCDALISMGQYDRAITSVQKSLESASDRTPLAFRLFCALVAVGRYEEANSLYTRTIDSQRFRDWSMKYVFDCLDSGRSWHPFDREPQGPPFLPMLEAEESYRHLSSKARRLITDGFSARWSPDGKKLAFSLGVHGYSAVATYEPSLRSTELLIVPGKDPVWSPDGQQIAFVRDCAILRLPDLTAAERRSQMRSYTGEEVWLMNADGTSPRRVGRGGWPSWSQDGKHLYYQSRVDNMLYSISTEKADVQPMALFANACDHPSVSPDGEYLAYVEDSSLKIVELASQTCVAEWAAPLRIWGGNWSPDGRQFSLGGVNRVNDRTGLWIYDLDRKDSVKVLDGQITVASWSPDKAQLLFSLGPPYFEIWTVDADPKAGMVEALDTDQTIDAYYEKRLAFYTECIEDDPDDPYNYFFRARFYDYLNDQDHARSDMNRYTRAATQKWSSDFVLGAVENLGPVINSSLEEAGTVVSADGRSLWFSRKPKGGTKWEWWLASRATEADPWEAPVNFGIWEDSHWNFVGVSHSFTTADGLEVYFSDSQTDRPGGYGRQDLWMKERSTVDEDWGPGVNLGDTVNSEYDEFWPALSPDGLELYFSGYARSYTRPGGYGRADLWVIRRTTRDDPWGEPVNLGAEVNTASFDGRPVISADALLLFFESDRAGGYGEYDLYVMRRQTLSEPWQEPVNLGPAVNSPANEECVYVSADASTLYFTSERPGGYGCSDIWQVRVTDWDSYSDAKDHSVSTVEQNMGKTGKAGGPAP